MRIQSARQNKELENTITDFVYNTIYRAKREEVPLTFISNAFYRKLHHCGFTVACQLRASLIELFHMSHLADSKEQRNALLRIAFLELQRKTEILFPCENFYTFHELLDAAQFNHEIIDFILEIIEQDGQNYSTILTNASPIPKHKGMTFRQYAEFLGFTAVTEYLSDKNRHYTTPDLRSKNETLALADENKKLREEIKKLRDTTIQNPGNFWSFQPAKIVVTTETQTTLTGDNNQEYKPFGAPGSR